MTGTVYQAKKAVLSDVFCSMFVRKPVCQTINNVAVAFEENQEAVFITLPGLVQQVLVRILRHTVIWGEHVFVVSIFLLQIGRQKIRAMRKK
jgi:hypothetical protein